MSTTFTFKQDTSSQDILEAMKGIHKEMEEKGLLTDKTTFEEMATYAGQHIKLTEKEIE